MTRLPLRWVLDHLIGMGYSRIAIVTGPLHLKNEARRLQGYQQSLKRAGIPLADDLVWQGNLRSQDLAAMPSRASTLRLRLRGPMLCLCT